ncbi:MAG: hypothetical protein GX660_05710 [Clostridiaceae bacterium]|nr:hypothetical protein [Clostridiaceae bacterium]
MKTDGRAPGNLYEIDFHPFDDKRAGAPVYCPRGPAGIPSVYNKGRLLTLG